ncbi:MAG: heat shock protein Hsp20 [Patescibacteria group bacterium]|nr:heat shock protein Hsp20 [Patescibacteria group bacterium]
MLGEHIMQLLSWNPLRELAREQDRLDRLLNDSFGSGALSQVSLPATDVYEQGGRLIVEVSLPNFDQKDIEVNLSDRGLEIKAERGTDNEVQKRKYLVRESSYGSFYRFITLPADADRDKAVSSFDQGILRVEIPLNERSQPKRLSISGGKDSNKRSEY